MNTRASVFPVPSTSRWTASAICRGTIGQSCSTASQECGLGFTTAASYAMSGLVDWNVTALLVAGGVIGTMAGIALGKIIGTHKGLLERGFAAVVIAVGTYVTLSSL